MIKDKKSLKATTPSRRKFFKAAAVTGAAAATAVAMPNIAHAAPVTAAALKNFRLEGVEAFNDFFSLIIISPLLVN